MANQQPMSDLDYNLISTIYHVSQGAETAAKYLSDAKKANDKEVTQFVETVHKQYVELAQQGMELLKQRMK